MNAAIWSTKTASPPPAFWPEGAKASANSPSVVMRVPVEGNGGAMRRPTGRSSPRGSRRAFRPRVGSSSGRCAATRAAGPTAPPPGTGAAGSRGRTWCRPRSRRFRRAAAPPRAPFQPFQRPLEGVAGGWLVRSPRHHVIERHRDVGAEAPLDLGGALGSEEAARAVHVALKLNAVVAHPTESREREHLEASRVGEQRAVPAHEAVQAAESRDDVLARADV